MEQVTQSLGGIAPYWDWLYAVIRLGFSEVNNVRGILIGLTGALVMTRFARLPVIVLGCLAADVAVRTLGPVVVNEAAMVLPPLVEAGFWRGMLALACGYVVVVTAIYAVKALALRLFDRGGHGHAPAHDHGH